jgi:hypothetical protein
MPQCSISDKSLRFSRAIYGILILAGFFLKDPRFVLVVIILLALNTITEKLNILYYFHLIFVKKLLKKEHVIIVKETAELRYVSGMTAILLLAGYLPIYYNKFASFGWVWLLVMSLLLFLACFAGFCVATLSYALFVKLFKKQKNENTGTK